MAYRKENAMSTMLAPPSDGDLLGFLRQPSSQLATATKDFAGYAAEVLGERAGVHIQQTTAADMETYVGLQRQLAGLLFEHADADETPAEQVWLLVHRAGQALDELLAVESPEPGSLAARLRGADWQGALLQLANLVRSLHGLGPLGGRHVASFEDDLDAILGSGAFLSQRPVHLDAAASPAIAHAIRGLHMFPQYYRADFRDEGATADFLRLAGQVHVALEQGS